MITEQEAREFADDWIASWNAHDLERIMMHYDDDVEYFSTFIVTLIGNPSGMLRGKEQVKGYLARALQAYPDLHFTLENIFVGVASITLKYQTVNKRIAVEVFELNAQGRVVRVQCHQQLETGE